MRSPSLFPRVPSIPVPPLPLRHFLESPTVPGPAMLVSLPWRPPLPPLLWPGCTQGLVLGHRPLLASPRSASGRTAPFVPFPAVLCCWVWLSPLLVLKSEGDFAPSSEWSLHLWHLLQRSARRLPCAWFSHCARPRAVPTQLSEMQSFQGRAEWPAQGPAVAKRQSWRGHCGSSTLSSIFSDFSHGHLGSLGCDVLGFS